MKYGFIGAGNITTGIIKGMIKKNITKTENISVYDISKAIQENFIKENKVTGKNSITELINDNDVIVLAVKPYILPDILYNHKDDFKKNNPVIVSVVASMPIKNIESNLEYEKIRLIRVMPNVNAQVLESMTGICPNDAVCEEDINIVRNIFNTIGKTIDIEEKFFEAFAAIAGSSPAFTYLYIDSVAKAGLKAGLNKKDAINIVAQSVLGSAKMILESGKHPLELVDMVSSPGGTTIEGLCALDEHGFQNAIIKAVDATINKDKLLSEKR